MHRARGATIVAGIAAFATLMIILQIIAPAAPSAVAFDHAWSKVRCSPTDVAEGLWDDAPGAGANNEAAFSWVANTEDITNFCIYSTQVGSINTSEYRHAVVRAAVNDGALFLTQFGEGTTGCGHEPGGSVFFETTISGSSSNSGFIKRNVTLPPGRSLTEVCIGTYSQSTASAPRYSALIDEIKSWNKATGAVAWLETFSAPG